MTGIETSIRYSRDGIATNKKRHLIRVMGRPLLQVGNLTKIDSERSSDNYIVLFNCYGFYQNVRFKRL